MRTGFGVGVVVMLCIGAQAAPRKQATRRTGPFAAYLDPNAPLDPPRPKVESGPRWLSVVFLFDRAASGDAVATAPEALLGGLEDGDLAALMAFDRDARIVLRADTVEKMRKRIPKALATLAWSPESDLGKGIAAAHEYLEGAPDARVIVAFTEVHVLDEAARSVIATAEQAGITVFLVVPGARGGPPASGTPSPIYSVDPRRSLALLGAALDSLRYRVRPRRPSADR